MTDLPTIEQCQTFLATINRGRVAIGLEPLDVLDFDGAVPDNETNCLSARNLFTLGEHPSGASTYVGPFAITAPDPRLCVVLDEGCWLPPSILAVTGPFDACSNGAFGEPTIDREALAALRARMVAAGVVR